MYNVDELKKEYDELSVVLQHVKTLLNKGYYQGEIAIALSSMGVLRPNGKPWDQSELSRFIKANRHSL